MREALFRVFGTDLSQIHGFSAYTVLKLVGECGMDMSRWPTVKHFTSWLTLAPGQQDIRREGAEYQNPTLHQSRGQNSAPCGGQCGPDADGARGLLPTAGRTRGQSQSGHGHGSQARGALLQYLAGMAWPIKTRGLRTTKSSIDAVSSKACADAPKSWDTNSWRPPRWKEFLRKATALLCQRVELRYAFMAQHQQHLAGCGAL